MDESGQLDTPATLKTFSTYFFLEPKIMYLVLAWLISNPILLAALSNDIVASRRDFGDLLIMSVSSAYANIYTDL
jgi:hypothetical protein